MVAAKIFMYPALFFVQTKKKPWASSLCHSLVRRTYGDLLLCYVDCVLSLAINVHTFLKGVNFVE